MKKLSVLLALLVSTVSFAEKERDGKAVLYRKYLQTFQRGYGV